MSTNSRRNVSCFFYNFYYFFAKINKKIDILRSRARIGLNKALPQKPLNDKKKLAVTKTASPKKERI